MLALKILNILFFSLNTFSDQYIDQVVVRLLSCLLLFETSWTVPGSIALRYIPEFAQIHTQWVHWVSSEANCYLNLGHYSHPGFLNTPAISSYLQINVWGFDACSLLSIQSTQSHMLEDSRKKLS